jgi:hypothetical protein
MGRPPEEFQAFTSLVDRLWTVPFATVEQRIAEHKVKAAQNPKKWTQAQGYRVSRFPRRRRVGEPNAPLRRSAS